MTQAFCRVERVEQVADNVFVLTFLSPEIASKIQPGQFLNIKADEGTEPLLRRPFGVYRCDGTRVQIIFNVVGKGTSSLKKKQPGEMIDVLGPLGIPFSLSDGFQFAVLVGGGLGVAPLPILTSMLSLSGIPVVTFLGARTSSQLVTLHLTNLHIATDDGSSGFHGNIVDLMKAQSDEFAPYKAKIFACGPTAMLRAVGEFAITRKIPCEVSLEGPMACGFGICQGCPVEYVHGEKKYGLMCKDGPTFDVTTIKI